MQRVSGVYVGLVRVEMEPVLTAVLGWTAVPGDAERLQLAVG